MKEKTLFFMNKALKFFPYYRFLPTFKKWLDFYKSWLIFLGKIFSIIIMFSIQKISKKSSNTVIKKKKCFLKKILFTISTTNNFTFKIGNSGVLENIFSKKWAMIYENPIIFNRLVILLQKTLLKVLFFVNFKFLSEKECFFFHKIWLIISFQVLK